MSLTFINDAILKEKTVKTLVHNAQEEYVKMAMRAQRRLGRTLSKAIHDESGMSTIEYAMGSIAAAALAAVLYMVVNGGGVEQAFESIITDALTNRPG